MGDRRLTAARPPVYDNPITTGFVDDRSGILFSSDCFGALLPEVPQDAADLDTAVLRAGQVRAIEPTMVCSSHLPPAPGAMLEVFVESLTMVPAAEPFVGPDHAALEAMPAGMAIPA